jgi:methionine synthase II (cobalamin-independent)
VTGEQRRRPWAPGAATAAGGMPGGNPLEAARIALGELPQLPFLPELPMRGVGAAMIGRALALLVDLPVETAPSGWRVADHRSRDERAARDLLARDLDALDQAAEETGSITAPLKVQSAGPWTVASQLELRSGHTVLSDPGARRDVAQSLAAGIAQHVADIRRRHPSAQVVLQVDEPALPAVLAGRVPTPSGLGTVGAIDEAEAQPMLGSLIAASGADAVAVHCCALDAPLTLLGRAGADAVSFDATTRIPARLVDDLGALVESGVALWPGVADAMTGPRTTARGLADSLVRLWTRTLGFPLDSIAAGIVPSSACGLSGAAPEAARRSLSLLAEAGALLLDPPVER